MYTISKQLNIGHQYISYGSHTFTSVKHHSGWCSSDVEYIHFSLMTRSLSFFGVYIFSGALTCKCTFLLGVYRFSEALTCKCTFLLGVYIFSEALTCNCTFLLGVYRFSEALICKCTFLGVYSPRSVLSSECTLLGVYSPRRLWLVFYRHWIDTYNLEQLKIWLLQVLGRSGAF